MLFINLYLCTHILRAAYINTSCFVFVFCGGFVCLYVWEFYLIYNNTLLYFTCSVESGFSIYLYRNWGSNQQRQFIIWQTLYHFPEKNELIPWESYWSTIPFRKKINEYWCRRLITLRWPIRPNSLGLATYLIQIAAPINSLGISCFMRDQKC